MANRRGVDPAYPKNNRFRRLVALCGLSQREAAAFLDVALRTVEQKASGLRGITEVEERRLLDLWERIRTGASLDASVPTGPRIMQLAHREARDMLDLRPVTEADFAWIVDAEPPGDEV